MKDAFIACHECDLLHRAPTLPDGARARCVRCGAALYSRKDGTIERVLALTVAGIILFALSNAFPLLTMRLDANVQQATLFTGVHQLYVQHMQGLAVLVFFTSIVVPLAQLSLLAYILLPLRLGLRAPWSRPAFRFLRRLQPWSMMEVFLLGVLVAMVKLSDTAEIIVGPALWSFAFLILVLAGITASLDPHTVWERLEPR